MRTGVFGERVGLVGMMMAVAVCLEMLHRVVVVPLLHYWCRLMSLAVDLRS
jgi:hypothetical protein